MFIITNKKKIINRNKKFNSLYNARKNLYNQNMKTKNNTLWQAIKFTLFSISAGVIQIAVFTLLQELIIKDINNEYGWSYFIALAMSVLWNFTFNRKFTFQASNNVPVAMIKVLLFYCAFTPLSIWWGETLTGIGWNEYIVLGMTMIINFITEFIYQKFVVFPKKKLSASEESFSKIMKVLKNPL